MMNANFFKYMYASLYMRCKTRLNNFCRTTNPHNAAMPKVLRQHPNILSAGIQRADPYCTRPGNTQAAADSPSSDPQYPQEHFFTVLSFNDRFGK